MMAQQNKPAEIETRIGTKVILRQMEGIRCDPDFLTGKKLHSEEVAAYVAKNSCNMLLAAQSAGLASVAAKLEQVFYDAFMKCNVEFDLTKLEKNEQEV